ncbi:MAG: FHA domain-containing protein [Planctomycetota bacterium]|nr:FHA domain-containing protein [Planctomycetota bacterium]
MMRRTIPLLITLVVGLVLVVSRFIPTIEHWGEDAAIWFDILAAIAFILGGGNLLKVHSQKIRRQVSGWAYSGVTMIFFLFVLFVGLGKVSVDPSNKYPFDLEVSHPGAPLAWLIAGERVHVVVLADGEEVTLGSGPGAQILLEGAGVGPVHCKVQRTGDEYRLVDLDSGTGTYLSGEDVGTAGASIRPGERFRAGTVGDPVVALRVGRSVLIQVVRPDEGAPVRIGAVQGAEVPIIAAGVADIAVQLSIGEENEVRQLTPGGRPSDQTLVRGEKLNIGPIVMVYRPNAWLTGNYQQDESWFMYAFRYGFKPLQSATFAMLAFYVASAAFRAFRAKNAEAIILLATAFLILLGRTYLGTVITVWVPDELEVLRVPNLTVWIMKVINAAGNRAIMIGIALGIASASLKVILGIDRSYLGGEG